jgi:hypothetical protein
MDLRSGQPPAGTAVRAEAYVFLPVPKRLWGAKELNANWASPEELAAIAIARKQGVVVRLYNPGKAEPREAILVHSAGREAEALQPLLDFFAQRWPVNPARPQLAICTQGTRDRCCAKWGFTVYKEALRLFEHGRSPFEPLECSHLGGDRFAATGIFFPSGSMYAHLDSLDLAVLIEQEAAGRIAPVEYRGRVFEPPLTQVVRAGLARDGLLNDTTAPLQVRRPDPAAPLALASADGRRFEVTLAAAEMTFYASCAKLADHRAATGQRTVYAGARELAASVAAS